MPSRLAEPLRSTCRDCPAPAVRYDSDRQRLCLACRARRQRLHAAIRIYRAVELAGFPPTYRLLCHNCNMARGLYGTCPHEAERLAEAG